MTITSRLSIARDLWWLTSSSVKNQAAAASSWTNGLWRSIDEDLGANDANYIENTTDSEGSYYFKVSHDSVVPDQVQIGIRAKNGDGSGTTVKVNVFINGLSLGSVGTFTSSISSVTQSFQLTDGQRKAILDARLDGMYDHIRYVFTCDDLIPNFALLGMRIYSTEIRYISNKDERYQNYNDQNEDIEYLYPTGLLAQRQTWQTQTGTTMVSSDFSRINEPPSGVDADTEYIRTISDGQLIGNSEATNGTNTIGYNRNYLMPSGYLSMFFNSSLDSMDRINRATLSLRMSLPVSGLGSNTRDSFCVEGYNPNIASGLGGQVLWGAGSIIEQSGFKNYDVDLCWLDPSLRTFSSLSGNVQSQYYKNADAFKGLELRLRGIPSGAYLSASELKLEYVPSRSLPLNMIGGNLSAETVSREPNAASSGAFHFWGNWPNGSGMQHLFNQLYFRFGESTGSTFMSDYGTISGTYQTNILGGTTCERYSFYKLKTHQILNDRWKNAVKLNGTDTISRSRIVRFSSNPDIPSGFTIFGHISPLSGFAYTTSNQLIMGKFGGAGSDFFIRTVQSTGVLRFSSFNSGGTLTDVDVTASSTIDALFACVYNHTASSVAMYYYHPINKTIVSGIKNNVSIRHTTGNSFRIGASATDTSTNIPSINFYGFIHELAVGQQPLNSSQIADLFYSKDIGIGNYLDVANTGSFMQWRIDVGSGNNYWASSFGLPTLPSSTNNRFYQIAGPAVGAYGNNPIVPSAVRFRMEVENTTSNPSGTYIKPVLHMNVGGTVSAYTTEIRLPSGTKQTVITDVLTQPNNIVTSGNYLGDVVHFSARHDHSITTDYRTDLRIYSLEALVDTYSTPVPPPSLPSGTPSNSGMALFVSGKSASFSNIDLYIAGKVVESSVIPLFLNNIGSDNSSIPLYVGGAYSFNSSIPLHMTSSAWSSGNIPLYMISTVGSSSGIDLHTTSSPVTTSNMRMFIKGTDYPNSSGSVYLYMRSSATPSLFNTFNMFMAGDDIDVQGELPLYIKGTPETDVAQMPLYIGSESNVSNYIPMIVFNERSGVNKAMNMYLEATDYVLYSSTMPLYMSRDKESSSHSSTLFLKADDIETKELNMYIFGHVNLGQALNFTISGSDSPSSTIPLYTHGF